MTISHRTDAPSLPSLTVTTSDPTGYEMVKVEIRPGDTLEYKRDGFRGHATGILLQINPRKKPLKIQPLDRDGKPSGSPLHRSHYGIAHAYRDGALLGVPEPFEGKVLHYDAGIPGQKNGWVTVLREGFSRKVEFNNHSPGWPSRDLTVGETVRCEMRSHPGYRHPLWFIVA